MENLLVNVYIERILKEVVELTKSKLLLETQLIYTEKLNEELEAKVRTLTEQIEKQTKKTVRKEDQQF